MVKIGTQLTQEQVEAIREIDAEGEFIFWGSIANICEEKLLTRSEAKEVFNALEIKNTKLRKFVYEQLKEIG